jgi:hypothetical protein
MDSERGNQKFPRFIMGTMMVSALGYVSGPRYLVIARMSWVTKRNTPRKEDKAYSLFGIFGVYMPLLYGEGEDKAFKRLREVISKHDHHLANLHSTDPHLDKKRIEEAKGGLLADAYRWVLDSHDFHQWHHRSEIRLLWI